MEENNTTQETQGQEFNQMSEEEALSGMSDNNTQETQGQEQTADTELDLSGVNEILGLNPQLQQEQYQQAQQEPQEDNTSAMLQQILQNQTQQPQEDEQDLAMQELISRLQGAGLGMSSEDKQLLENINQKFEQMEKQQAQQQAYEEHQQKVGSLDEFSKSLEGLIPGYSNDFMINLVSQIVQGNPQAGEEILNNPTMLIKLWGQYGANAQPQQTNNSVINTNTQTNNQSSLSALEQKVMNGTASESEEAYWLSHS